VNRNATLTGSGIINFSSGGNITGTLGVTGGNWNGAGTVTGLGSLPASAPARVAARFFSMLGAPEVSARMSISRVGSICRSLTRDSASPRACQ
jgi:hypothetical protein